MRSVRRRREVELSKPAQDWQGGAPAASLAGT